MRFEEVTIKQVIQLGHEIGYHYEDMDIVSRRSKVKIRKSIEKVEEALAVMAIESFRENLAKLRDIVPVDTICMHGSPLSPADSRVLWKYYDYSDMGISAEPYFDFLLKICFILRIQEEGGMVHRYHSGIRDGNGYYFRFWRGKPQPGMGSLMNMTGYGHNFSRSTGSGTQAIF